MKHSRISVVAVLAACLALAAVPVWSRGVPEEPLRTISVQGMGSVTAESDTVIVDVGVAVVADSAIEASQAGREQMARIYRALADAGIPEGAIETTNVSLYSEPTPAGPDSRETRQRYRARNAVRVTSDRIDDVGSLVDTLVGSGANQLMGVRFSVSDPQPYQDAAWRVAVADARRQAELVAAELDLGVGEVVRASTGSPAGGAPVAYAAMGRGGESTPVSPGSIEFRQSVTVEFALE